MSDRASSPTPASNPTPQQKLENADVRVPLKEESPSLSSPNLDPPSSSPSRQIRRSAEERRAHLLNDPLCEDLEPRQVLCRACRKWIKLSQNSEYSLGNWNTHKQRCSGLSTSPRSVRRTPSKPSFSPSSRVATAERKIVLLNDPQVRVFSVGHVHCGTCKTAVALGGEIDYDLTNWTEHKEKCIPLTPAPITPRPRVFPPPSTSSTHSQVSANRSARSPTPSGEGSSSQSTDTTAVAESSLAAVNVGVKRGRDEETEEEEDAGRPTNRPRTATYGPPAKDAPGLFGWLAHPLKEFARGFREGLEST